LAGWDWNYPYAPQPLPDGSDPAQRLLQAEESIRRLEERLKQAEKQLEELRARPPLHVEYHFDQLKVNELKGTLNVGLSPQGVQGIEALELPGGMWNVAAEPQSEEPIPQLQQYMLDYMDREGPLLLTELEAERGMALDDTHRLRLIADIKKQLNERVHYYGKTTPYPSAGSEQEKQEWKKSVADRTIRDVRTALSTYLDKWKHSASGKKGGSI
jgi:spore germination protein PC